MRTIAVTLLILALGAGAPPFSRGADASDRPVAGTVTDVDRPRRTVKIGPTVFHVPHDVYDLRRLIEGQDAVVWFEQTERGRVATALEVQDEPE